MSKCRIMVAFLLLVIYGCASERLYVKVVDDEGAPVSNATVNVGFSSGHVVFGQGRSCDYKAQTDQDGNAVVRFNGDSSDVYWSVKSKRVGPVCIWRRRSLALRGDHARRMGLRRLGDC